MKCKLMGKIRYGSILLPIGAFGGCLFAIIGEPVFGISFTTPVMIFFMALTGIGMIIFLSQDK